MNKKQRKMLLRIIIATISLIIFSILSLKGLERFIAYITAYLIIGYDIVKKALKGIKNKRPYDESLLMTIATMGAILLALYQQTKGQAGDYTEAVAVMLFYQIGEFFQSVAVGKSRKNIAQLMDVRPDYANIEKDGKIVKVSPEEVEIGSIITVIPGEKIPLDGVIVEGNSSLNTAFLTGESVPREVCQGDEVVSPSINLSGLLKIKTTKNYGDSTASKILELVENASSRKSKSENFISKFARVYTPIVVFCALVLAILPPLANILFLNSSANWSVWIYRALVFLVISCPCALVVSIPLTFFATIGGISRAGVLVKGSNYLEILSKIKTIVFDKTGTLTEGNFKVNAIHHNKIDEESLIEYAALAESASTHPIALSLKSAYKKELDISRIKDIQELSGNGVIAKIDEREIMAGNEKLMEKFSIEYIKCHSTGTIIHIAIDREYMGHIVISDVIKPDSFSALKRFRELNIKNIVMLTGDLEKAAMAVAKQLDIEKVYAQLSPIDKVQKIEELIDGKNVVAFVGDGINDAPVLSRADIGITMGRVGSDAALEAGDVVLMDDNPSKIADAIKISKKCLNIVKQNICFAIGVKVLCMILGAFGIANMWAAVFADVGVMIICILNALRALFVKA